MLRPLPIDTHLDTILSLVRDHPITIIEAPPGTGKTTRVAPALLKSTILQADERMYLLQPRRLAARSVAERIAYEHGSDIGHQVGYQVRFDSQVSRGTQLIVATEGILLRRLQEDATIGDTKIVLLDEFHERSLDADLLLGMLRRVQQTMRDDLRLIIMSATIESEFLQSQLGHAPIVRVEGQTYPVTVRYRPPKPQQRSTDHVIETLLDIVPKDPGDVLVFLPGAGEIHRCADELERTTLARQCQIVRLYGSMNLDDQSRAILPGDKRRIVLSTNVAETSLTIEGIRIVIDSGYARILRYAPDVGIDRLALEPICQSSATQRTGRAGRVAEGTCYRLWSEASHRSRSMYLDPEIRRVDLVGALLQLYVWGEGESNDFPWLEPPRVESIDKGRELLAQLGAIDHGRVTELGLQMAHLPLHPRLARMVIEGDRLGCLDRVGLLAAMLSEREPFDRFDSAPRSSGRSPIATSSVGRWESDCVERVLAIERFLDFGQTATPFGSIHVVGVRNIVNAAKQIRDQSRSMSGKSVSRTDRDKQKDAPELLMRALLVGFPDRLAKRRGVGKASGLMVGGTGVQIGPKSGVHDGELFLCIELQQGGAEAIVRQASHVEASWLPPSLVVEQDELFFHPSQKQVVARRRTQWLDLVLKETPTSIEDSQACAKVLFAAAKQHWQQAFPANDERLVGLIQRVACLRDWLPEADLPPIDESFLDGVLLDLSKTRRSLSELLAAPWFDWIQARFTSEQWQWIEREAPERLRVPSGSWIKIQYVVGQPPTMAVKIQEVFSLRETPRLARGRVPVLLHLLSPSMRPQQVTNDLASFWANGYPIVKKELKRRYPKHNWPEDPINATPGRK